MRVRPVLTASAALSGVLPILAQALPWENRSMVVVAVQGAPGPRAILLGPKAVRYVSRNSNSILTPDGHD